MPFKLKQLQVGFLSHKLLTQHLNVLGEFRIISIIRSLNDLSTACVYCVAAEELPLPAPTVGLNLHYTQYFMSRCFVGITHRAF